MKKYAALLRIPHYIKNLLVFVPLICSGRILEVDRLLSGIHAFVIFCAASSFVYILNDIHDCEKDRLHPVKCSRPIASGEISKKRAGAVLLVVFAVLLWFVFADFSWYGMLLPGIYILINLAYTYKLKEYALLDITALSSGFLLRIIFGSVMTGVINSDWLYMTVFSFSFFFAMGKRRNELQYTGSDTRTVLKEYPKAFLDKGMTVCMTLGNVFYALWSINFSTVAQYNNRNIFFTALMVLLITLKYSLNLESMPNGDPVDILLQDKILLAMSFAYLAVMFSLLYIR